eukprot:UN10488
MATPNFANIFDKLKLGGRISIKPMRQKARIRASISPSLADLYVKQKNRLKSVMTTSREVTKSHSVADSYKQQKNKLKAVIITSRKVTESSQSTGDGNVDGYDTESSLESTDKQSVLSQDKMNKKKSYSETKVVKNLIEPKKSFSNMNVDKNQKEQRKN